MQSFRNKIQRLLAISFIILFASLLSTQEAQACRTGTCYENGISPNNPKACDPNNWYSCPSSPCYWISYWERCRGHNPVPDQGLTTTITYSCLTDGATYYYVRCTHCSQPHLYSSSATSATGHSWSAAYGVWWDANNHYWDCQNAHHNSSYDGAKTVSGAHNITINYTDWTLTGSSVHTNPTCTTNGITKYSWIIGKYCNVCGWDSRQTKDTTASDIPATGHSMSLWNKVDNNTHKSTCSTCGHTHSQAHTAGDWLNSGKGYRYKNCVGSSVSSAICADGYCNITDTNGCGATEIITQKYKLTLTLNYNGGTLNNQSSSSRTIAYGSTTQLPTPSKAGYTFKGWGYNKDTYNVSYSGGQSVTSQTINSSLKDNDQSATLYAQWEKTIKYNINYLDSNGTQKTDSFYVVYRNNATSANITSYDLNKYYYVDSTSTVTLSGAKQISTFKDNSKVTKNNYSDWVERGIAKGNTTSWVATIGSTLSSSVSEVSASSGTINYYASYQRKPQITFYDYGTNALKTVTKYGSVTIAGVTYDTAGMCYNGTVDRKPVFTFPTQNTMVYGEKLTSNVSKNETWTSTGWSLDKVAGAKTYSSGSSLNMGTNYVSSTGTSKMASYGNYIYYGNYQKDVKLTYNPNGGKVGTSSVTYTRYANTNSSTPTTTTKTYNVPNAYYKDSSTGLTVYTQESWSYVAPSASNNYWINNEDYRNYMAFRNINTGYYSENKTIWQYTPLVSETVYSTWTNESKDVTVLKDAIWDNPKSDNINVDFEGLENIDINGIAKVTLTVTLNKANTQYVASNLQIEDYFNTAMWDFVDSSVSKGTLNRASDGTLLWTIGNVTVNKTTTITATYRLRLKEEYWTVDADGNKVKDYTNYYINPMNGKSNYATSVQAYLNSLVGTINSDKTYDVSKVSLDRENFYYKESAKAHKSYIYVNYHYDSNDIDGTQRYVAYPVDYVRMRDVDWKPEVSTDISISSDKNNIYYILNSDNKYFVQYDTHSNNDSANSVFKLNINSMLDRSSSFYQITNNILNISNTTNGDIDNFIAVDNSNANLVFNSSLIPSTKQQSTKATTDGSILKLKSALSIRSSVANKLNDSRTAYYLNGAVSTQDIVYATNQDGLTFDIVPNVLITDADDNKQYLFADTNKKITLTVDATNPIITPKFDMKTTILNKSNQEVAWTSSDGYIDINLVTKKTDPEPKSHTLVFEFEDKVSGVNDPRATNDWISSINDNVQITLKNLDTNTTIFQAVGNNNVISDYNRIKDIIKVNYQNAGGMNNKGTISLTLDPNNENLLGHLQLTIKVIDNVGNWETKTYDIYSFCITGVVGVVDTLPNSGDRLPAEIWNGEQGKVQISANGWIDRVSVNFDYLLVNASKKEIIKRNNITGDDYNINGDYPYDDSNLTASKETVTYLANKYLKCKWGYTNGELGGMPLSLAELSTVQDYYLNNDILNAHLDELIANYITRENGFAMENVFGSNYAIIGTTLYTYPVYSGDEIRSYLNSYTLDGVQFFDNDTTPYPVNVIIDGSKYATINYTEKYVKDENGEVVKTIVPSIEEQTLFSSEWVKVGNEYLRPLVHYFYMPTYAEVKDGKDDRGNTDLNDKYRVEITAYKDSNTEYVHKVSIELTLTNNNYGGSIKDLQTNIKDN